MGGGGGGGGEANAVGGAIPDMCITYAIIVTDLANVLQKVECGMGCPASHTAINTLRLQRLLLPRSCRVQRK